MDARRWNRPDDAPVDDVELKQLVRIHMRDPERVPHGIEARVVEPCDGAGKRDACCNAERERLSRRRRADSRSSEKSARKRERPSASRLQEHELDYATMVATQCYLDSRRAGGPVLVPADPSRIRP
jgi:hypothetical protein